MGEPLASSSPVFVPKEGHTESVKSEHYLFNDDNLIAYEVNALKGLNMLHQQMRRTDKPFSGIRPAQLSPKVAQLDLDVPLGDMESTFREVEEIYLKHAVYFHHPRYVAHLNCPVAYPAVVAEQLLTAVNTSVDTWDQSAGGTLIEQKLIDWTCGRIGFDDNADGIFTSGGTQSNLMAMLMARDHYCRQQLADHCVRTHGLPSVAHRMRIFTSQVSHFSVQKSAAILGLGYDAVVAVPTDEKFKMDAEKLREAVEQAKADGLLPIAVVATAGTTDYGSIDPLHEIAEICQQHDIWMHADAAYGCGLLATQHHRDLLSGIELADSVTVDYHKSWLQPVSCSAFFLKNKSHFATVTHHADYLNPLCQAGNGQPNLVDKSIQTTRRFDALKLWMTLRTMGADAIGQAFEQVMSLAKQSYVLMNQDEHFELLHFPELSTLVFRYVPSFEVDDATLDEANAQIRATLFASGESIVAGTKHQGRRYLKFTLLNPATKLDDIREVLSHIKAAGQQYFQQLKANDSMEMEP